MVRCCTQIGFSVEHQRKNRMAKLSDPSLKLVAFKAKHLKTTDQWTWRSFQQSKSCAALLLEKKKIQPQLQKAFNRTWKSKVWGFFFFLQPEVLPHRSCQTMRSAFTENYPSHTYNNPYSRELFMGTRVSYKKPLKTTSRQILSYEISIADAVISQV